MAIIPNNKQWTQPNDGDSLGNLFSTWGVDLESNRGTLTSSNPLKNVYDTTDDADLDSFVFNFHDYDSKLWGLSDVMFDTSTSSGVDITDGSNWSQDTSSGTPSVGNTVSDSVVFNNLLLVQDGNDIKARGASSWSSWWQGTLGQASLETGRDFILTVGSDGNLYIVDGGNKVYRVDKDGATVSKTGEGTLDYSATDFFLKNATVTSSRIFYGTEDTAGEDCAIIEWDMGPQSISANRVHQMGVKRILSVSTWNGTVIAILSDGSIKYHNGSSFVNWDGAHLPQTKNQYKDDVIHKNGWAIIDDLPHFLINPAVDIDSSTLIENSGNYWNYPAGIYCLDPKVGLYCRYTLSDGTNPHFSVKNVGALFSKNHGKTKFFASYELYPTTTTTNALIACEDATNSLSAEARVVLQPLESVQNIVKKIKLVHKRMGTGDVINLYYRRYDEDAIRLSGNWLSTTEFNTTETITGIEKGWIGFVKAGTGAGFLSTIKSYSEGTTSTIEFNDAASVTANDAGVLEFVNFKHFGTITNKMVEISDFTIPQPQTSRQVWVMIELKQAAGNDLQIDYIISE